LALQSLHLRSLPLESPLVLDVVFRSELFVGCERREAFALDILDQTQKVGALHPRSMHGTYVRHDTWNVRMTTSNQIGRTQGARHHGRARRRRPARDESAHRVAEVGTDGAVRCGGSAL